MKILLVGNGFDLHHMYPTSYINFLHTFQFLTEHYAESLDSIGKIMGNPILQENDKFIKECYAQHFQIYNMTPLSVESTIHIIEKAKSNIWYNYFCSCCTKDIRWIDFEKEIIRIIEAFSVFFNSCELNLFGKDVTFDLLSLENVEDSYILKQFPFFFERYSESIAGGIQLQRIKSEYIHEKVVGSKSYHLKTDDIISELFNSLTEFASVLQWYLLHFVDAPSKEYATLGIKPQWSSYPYPYRVYSFNYTNTIELLYGTNMVDHIHGNTQTHIVLGVNPDENDSLSNMDTSFLQFKKYFQRTFFRTDHSYIKSIQAHNATPRNNDNHLFVVGHSLDSTDKDIIMQIFRMAKKITILYHKESSVKNLICNLVEMYGKDGLDELRTEQDLQFLPQAAIEWVSC